MTTIFLRVAVRVGRRVTALVSFCAALPLAAQQPSPRTADTTVALTLDDAARLAARQSAAAEAALLRAEQAGARVPQRRSELLLNVSATACQRGYTPDARPPSRHT
jgi:hypothetical protein